MNNLSVNELDFDAVKEDLIEWLSLQSEFQDYDFTGSALNTLVDVCAYLIHYVGIQANFALRESFLESAQLRKNVTDIAKELGYFPSQVKAGRSSFTLTIDLAGEPQPGSIVVPKGTTFVSTLQDGSSLTFSTYDDNVLVDSGLATGGVATGIWSGTINVAQGVFANQFWVVTGSNDQKFLIEQPDVDTDFLKVTVRPNEASTDVTTWTLGSQITEVDSTTEAFFVQEDGDGLELYFGNGVIGKQLEVNNYVQAEYLVTAGSVSNGIKRFTLTEDIAGYSRNNFVISAVEQTSDAADREDIRSIKFLAPLSYQRQNRIVTIEDYKTAVLENYSNVRAINAWGGEDAIPPEYGKVFVSVAPVFGDTVSPTTKKSIEEDVLSRFNVVGITPEIIDPEYTTINLDTVVTYNRDRTTLTGTQIASEVKATIEDYLDSSVFDYNQSFKYSKFLAAVDGADASITSSLSTVTATKAFVVAANTPSTFRLKFYNGINSEVGNPVTSSTWTNTAGSTYQIRTGRPGKLDLYTNGTLTKANVGSFDYVTGEVVLPGFNPKVQNLGQEISFTIKPSKLDVEIRFNSLARLGINNVTVIAETR